MKLVLVCRSQFGPAKWCVAFGTCSVHLNEDGSLHQVWVKGAERHPREPTRTALRDYSERAIAYEALTGTVEGFPEQEFDL